MRTFIGLAAASLLVGGAIFVATTSEGEASDHDDGEIDAKPRSLNLTDHFAFKSTDSPTDLTLIMYFNPRSLPSKQYFLNTNARYEFHVSRVGARDADATVAENVVFRFEGGAPNAAGEQPITMTVLKDGVVEGTPHVGTSTSYGDSRTNTVGSSGSLKINTGTTGTTAFKYFIGMRADAFTFDVLRFFQVRQFLAERFFGKVTKGDNTAVARFQANAPNCKGQVLLGGQTALGGTPEADGDEVNLFNPPECAPDFTKNYNVTAIVLNVPIAALGGGAIFDTWSTISVAQ